MTEHDATILRDVRLRALSDTPLAFGSTYAREFAFTPEEWKARAKQFSSMDANATFLAFDELGCCGIVGSLKVADSPGTVMLVSMWVDPRARRLGLARRLIGEIESWAMRQNAAEIVLDVNEINQIAIDCYKRCGFEFTGRSFPYPNAPNLLELTMRKILA